MYKTYYYKNRDANHSIALIAENNGDILHFYAITSDGEVQRNLGLMSWETVGSYNKASNIITVTKDRKSNCRILRKFGYVVK